MCTSLASSAAGVCPLAAVPEARSSFLLVLSVAGTRRNASSQNKDVGLHYVWHLPLLCSQSHSPGQRALCICLAMLFPSCQNWLGR